MEFVIDKKGEKARQTDIQGHFESLATKDPPQCREQEKLCWEKKSWKESAVWLTQMGKMQFKVIYKNSLRAIPIKPFA